MAASSSFFFARYAAPPLLAYSSHCLSRASFFFRTESRRLLMAFSVSLPSLLSASFLRNGACFSVAALEASSHSGVGLPFAFGGGCMPTHASTSACDSAPPSSCKSGLSVSNGSAEPAVSLSTSCCSLAAALALACLALSSASARLAATSFISVSGSSSFHVLDCPSRVASSRRTPIAVSASSRTWSQAVSTAPCPPAAAARMAPAKSARTFATWSLSRAAAGALACTLSATASHAPRISSTGPFLRAMLRTASRNSVKASSGPSTSASDPALETGKPMSSAPSATPTTLRICVMYTAAFCTR
mmetsp:Transcript_8859/g.26352  ORF Transcript_8859/g.26352 Transcript_8859/m.26352 type:complete len:303 (+) Transcript_8859:167-1075(+)